jgi:hypothetical protein
VNIEISSTTGRSYSDAWYIPLPGGSTIRSWSTGKPGNVTLYPQYSSAHTVYSDSNYSGIVAHEFGHVFGLGDAYENKGFLGFDSRPPAVEGKVNAKDIMNDSRTGTASTLDVSMILSAHSTGRQQIFPLK